LISRKYLWKSFSIWKKTKGPNHPDLAEIYRYMGLYFKRYNFNDSAMYCFNKAKSLFDRRYGQANLLSIKCLNNLANVYARIPSMESKILPTYQLCEDLTARQKSPLRMARVMTLYNMAEYFNIRGDNQLALKYLNERRQSTCPQIPE